MLEFWRAGQHKPSLISFVGKTQGSQDDVVVGRHSRLQQNMLAVVDKSFASEPVSIADAAVAVDGGLPVLQIVSEDRIMLHVGIGDAGVLPACFGLAPSICVGPSA